MSQLASELSLKRKQNIPPGYYVTLCHVTDTKCFINTEKHYSTPENFDAESNNGVGQRAEGRHSLRENAHSEERGEGRRPRNTPKRVAGRPPGGQTRPRPTTQHPDLPSMPSLAGRTTVPAAGLGALAWGPRRTATGTEKVPQEGLRQGPA